MANGRKDIPERIWKAIFKEKAEGATYAALARKWGPKVEKEYGRKLTAALISARWKDDGDSASDRRPKDIWDLVDMTFGQIPAAEWDDSPGDGAAQHDHYIYGVPKRR